MAVKRSAVKAMLAGFTDGDLTAEIARRVKDAAHHKDVLLAKQAVAFADALQTDVTGQHIVDLLAPTHDRITCCDIGPFDRVNTTDQSVRCQRCVLMGIRAGAQSMQDYYIAVHLSVRK